MSLVNTKPCIVCGKPSKVEVPDEAQTRYAAGMFWQQAWPEGSADDRELLISGTHPECWETFAPDDD